MPGFLLEKFPAILPGRGRRGQGWDKMEMPEPEGSLGGSGKLEAGRIDPACKRVCFSQCLIKKPRHFTYKPRVLASPEKSCGLAIWAHSQRNNRRAERHSPLETRQELLRWPQGSMLWRYTWFSTRPFMLVLNFINFLKEATTQKNFKNYVSRMPKPGLKTPPAPLIPLQTWLIDQSTFSYWA